MYNAEIWDRVDGAGYLTAMVDGRLPEPTHFSKLGLRVTSASVGSVQLRWHPTMDLLNPHGVVHGGFIAAVLDVAAGLSAASTFTRFLHVFTLEMRIDFIRPVTVGDEAFAVTGVIARRGRRSLLADGWVGQAEDPLARIAATYVPNRATLPRESWAAAGL